MFQLSTVYTAMRRCTETRFMHISVIFSILKYKALPKQVTARKHWVHCMPEGLQYNPAQRLFHTCHHTHIQIFVSLHVPKTFLFIIWFYALLIVPGACCSISSCPLLAVLFVGVLQTICGPQGQYEVWCFSTELYLAFSQTWPPVRANQVIINTCEIEINLFKVCL